MTTVWEQPEEATPCDSGHSLPTSTEQITLVFGNYFAMDDYCCSRPPSYSSCGEGGPAARFLPHSIGGVGNVFSQFLGCFNGKVWLPATVQAPPTHVQGCSCFSSARPRAAAGLTEEINTLLRKGAIRELGHNERRSGFYSSYFLVPKRDGGFRPILDLRPLNQYLRPLHFKCCH